MNMGTRVMWWRVNWMFARPIFTDQVVARRMHAVNWRRARRGTFKRFQGSDK